MNAQTLAVKIALSGYGYMEEMSGLKVAAATRQLTRYEDRSLKMLTSLVERDRNFLQSMLNLTA